MTRRALLIVNNKSRSGETQCKTAIESLRAHDIEPVHVECKRREDMSPLIVRHKGQVDCVVVGGGDGTINAAALGVIEADLPLGILPLGTANDLARTLEIPPDLDGAADIIAAGKTRRIDLGLVNGEPFFNVASLGLSAELAQKLTRDIKRRYGRLGYALVALKVLLQARPFRAIITTETETVRVRTLQIAVGNGVFYGGGNAVEQDAAIDDQHLDLYSLELERAWKLALMARSFRYGRHGAWSEVRAIKAKEFDIRTRRPRPINADGEIATQTPAHFTIKPCAVTVFTP
ncbi:lipid kinase [Microvirga aerophila]|uniref:Lipid kinase n=1 Tax=Microvirga aerophila TaxID=670291 RepID=A0A512BPI9_9HYPH|nr:lipid kinase [Microvirga aerophila]GEO13878.1 lipid kinase [Microvirga aerophila]